MKSIAKQRRDSRIKRHRRIRKRLRGTQERPRLCVFRTSKHVYAQIVDDVRGVTLGGASSQSPELGDELQGKNKTEISRRVGELVAERAKAAGIEKVCFDRGGYLYHGRIKAFAEGARKGGLEF
ncbi:MAG: 50S ribosomal protein L18 [Candidatus Eisenbacteria bacterium]|nr:50S ribosomal protein L18 [Candidatus Eisenbacteria bacterium]